MTALRRRQQHVPSIALAKRILRGIETFLEYDQTSSDKKFRVPPVLSESDLEKLFIGSPVQRLGQEVKIFVNENEPEEIYFRQAAQDIRYMIAKLTTENFFCCFLPYGDPEVSLRLPDLCGGSHTVIPSSIRYRQDGEHDRIIVSLNFSVLVVRRLEEFREEIPINPKFEHDFFL